VVELRKALSYTARDWEELLPADLPVKLFLRMMPPGELSYTSWRGGKFVRLELRKEESGRWMCIDSENRVVVVGWEEAENGFAALHFREDGVAAFNAEAIYAVECGWEDIEEVVEREKMAYHTSRVDIPFGLFPPDNKWLDWRRMRIEVSEDGGRMLIYDSICDSHKYVLLTARRKEGVEG